jgi:hypothetical protein
VKLYLVAHGDHHVAFDEIKAVGRWLELSRRLAGKGRVGWGRGRCGLRPR